MQPDLVGGRYRVLSAIGKGGMGTVWRCRDETLHREVAVKQVGLLPGESVTDSARALREARSSAALTHRNVVTVFDVVEEPDQIWLVMELVPGSSLSQMIARDGPLDPALVADIGAQVADGLAAAHAAGTTHRDVKPGNILVREDGVAKISDFGIARNVADPALTQSGFMTGTPGYFSPELAQGADPGPETDVWALGATLYAAVEGHPPYEQNANPVAVLHDIASNRPPRPQRADYLEPALMRMLDRDVGSRWSMADAAHVLRRLADQHRTGTLETLRPDPAAVPTEPEPEPAHPTAPAPLAAAADNRTRRRVPATTMLLVGTVVAAVVAVVLLLTQRDPAPPAGAQPDDTTSEKSQQSQESSSSDEQTDTAGSSGESDQAEAMEEFVQTYYAVAPGGTDEAWSMLGPGLKEQGRESFDRFWRTVESVEVKSAQARPASDTVDVVLVYRTTDGRVSTERKQEGLVPDGDGYLLDTDVPAG